MEPGLPSKQGRLRLWKVIETESPRLDHRVLDLGENKLVVSFPIYTNLIFLGSVRDVTCHRHSC